MSRLREALLARRERYNTAFAVARRARPSLCPEAFSEHLLEVLEPIVERLEPQSLARAVEELYDLSLDLVGSELLGPNSRHPAVVAGWERLLPRLGRFVSQQPRQLAAELTNALYHLSATPGARPLFWLGRMQELADQFENADELRAVGQVLAWMAGLAHFREGALEVLARLDSQWARQLLDWDVRHLDDLARRPWTDPECGQRGHLEVVARVGAFRGFGGLFVRPPRVSSAGQDRFVVDDTEATYLLCADHFGATFHRLGEPIKHHGEVVKFSLWEGTLTVEGQELSDPAFLQVASTAAGPTTVAITLNNSHAVLLAALR
ncbi:MAG: hypothetical protein KC910_06190 [Candidatus Eremiobacteraeota bacterium]|nr:hypothetical protein [Candidatus Eremiobacteraeota bacterium]